MKKYITFVLLIAILVISTSCGLLNQSNDVKVIPKSQVDDASVVGKELIPGKYQKFLDNLSAGDANSINTAIETYTEYTKVTSDKSLNDAMFREFMSFYSQAMKSQAKPENMVFVKSTFVNSVSDGMNKLLSIKSMEASQGWVKELLSLKIDEATHSVMDSAFLAITWNQLSDRIIAYEDFVKSYSTYPEAKDIKSTVLPEYFMDYLLGSANTPAFLYGQDRTIDTKLKASYERFINSYKDSSYQPVIKDYYDTLKKDNFIYNKDIEKYLTNNTELGAKVATFASETEKYFQSIIKAKANAVITALKQRDTKTLSEYIHPDKGVLFSPYANVDINSNLNFSSTELKNILSNKTKFTWGSYDGSGEPMKMTFEEYFNKFIYDKAFITAPDIGYNRVVGSGNSINNSFTVYPNSIIVEYHFPGFDTKYEGIDWESLRLVFEQKENTWYLVAIIHDQWTI